MKQILFFALREDILPILEDVEKNEALRYVRSGNFLSPDRECFGHGADIPNLGTASADTTSACEAFVISNQANPVKVRHLKIAGGVDRYLVDQLVNPDTVTFTPAGIWGADFVLHGRVATVSDSATSQTLMKRFLAAFRKQFNKVDVYWMGSGASTLFAAGKRFTMSAQSPREFDLTVAVRK